LQKRLDDMLASQGLNAATLTQRVLAVHAGKRRLPLSAFETLAKATLERKQVQIAHLNRQNGQVVQRDISPQQLVHYRDNWYVDAWCHLRGGVRSFSVDAISQARLLGQASKDIDLISMRQQLDGGYGIFAGAPKAWAQLLFSPARAPWVQQEIWHPQQKSQTLPDDHYELVVPYADERELIGDILRFGASVQVVGPARLREQVQAEIQRMLAQYP
jgi:predicted DNA-binding transcriptional regulator YafY